MFCLHVFNQNIQNGPWACRILQEKMHKNAYIPKFDIMAYLYSSGNFPAQYLKQNATIENILNIFLMLNKIWTVF